MRLDGLWEFLRHQMFSDGRVVSRRARADTTDSVQSRRDRADTTDSIASIASSTRIASSTATYGGAYAGGGSCATSIPAKLTKLAAESQGNKELAAKAEKDTVIMKERLKGLQKQCDQFSALAETLETERNSLSEQLSVALAERKLIDSGLGRADSAISELRRERDGLAARLADSQANNAILLEQRQADDAERAALEKVLSVAQAERQLIDAHVERTSALLQQSLNAGAQHKAESDAKLQMLEDTRDELRAEKAALQEALIVEKSERKRLEDSLASFTAHSQNEMASLRASLRAAENRESEARSLQAKAEQERTSLHRKLDLATAERHMLQAVTGRMQVLQLEERAAMQAARDRAEVSHGELSARLEAAETAALESAKSVTSIEEDRKWLSERYTLTTGQLKQGQSELNQLYEELSALNARHQALQLERATSAASAQVLEERLREVQSQRDAAESERMDLQRELSTSNSRLQDADERARSAEAALSVAQSEVAVGKSELRERKALCIELERQRDAMTRQHSRLQEQLVLSLSPPTPRTIS